MDPHEKARIAGTLLGEEIFADGVVSVQEMGRARAQFNNPDFFDGMMIKAGLYIPELANRVDRVQGHGPKKREFVRWYENQGQAPPGQPPKKRRHLPPTHLPRP